MSRDFKHAAVMVRRYKCFRSDEWAGFSEVKPVNVIIGRNASGKSTLLDLIDHVTQRVDIHQGNVGPAPEVQVGTIITQQAIADSFPPTAHGGPIPGNHFEFGKKWIGEKVKFTLDHSRQRVAAIVEPEITAPDATGHAAAIARKVAPWYSNMRSRRLRAERDMRPEAFGTIPSHTIGENGSGATNLLANYVLRSSFDSDLVEKTLLSALNSVFAPDSLFSRIQLREIGDNLWEVFLHEDGKGAIRLSLTGSGIRTVLLVLATVLLVPALEKTSPAEYLFCFEELENNLHPALQRRLFAFLRKIAVDQGSHVFITTHSHVAIDLFAHDSEAQLIHVIHDKQASLTRLIASFRDKSSVLDDLDIRASDLLQANGVIWVEGPSDRSYLNRWIDVTTSGRLKEGVHYQCAIYGGRLLSHFSAEAECNEGDLIALLRVNRNAALLADRDSSTAEEELSATKLRLVAEMQAIGGLVWITAGRDIENYLSARAVSVLMEATYERDPEQFEQFADYLDTAVSGAGRRFEKGKTSFASRIAPILSEQDIAERLDLAPQLAALVARIHAWNRTEAET
jgi:energy-coupling factor transporter ATP-binding protein EcfA2